MTSNAGSNSKTSSVGFDRTAHALSEERAMKALKEFLRPEFINRVDEIICFNQLSEQDFKQIASIMLTELKTALSGKSISFQWEDGLLDYLVKKSYSTTYGARHLRRSIQKELEDKIALIIIQNYATPISGLVVTSDGTSLQLDVLS